MANTFAPTKQSALFVIDNDPQTYTAVSLMRDNQGDEELANLLFDMATLGTVGQVKTYGGGGAASFKIMRVR